MTENGGRSSGSGVFGSFFLSGSEFAVSVAHLQEVVDPPASYSSLPLAPPHLLGLFNLRGAIIPVVDLGRMLRLQAPAEGAERKIAILELEGHCVGLVFDRTSEIFRGREDERADFDDPGREGVVRGVFRKDGGKRIIQILDVEALFSVKGVLRAGQQAQRRGSSENRKSSRRQCISFDVGSARCALGIAEFHEILRFDGLIGSALATGSCIGAMDLRGSTVPVVDFAALLGYRQPLAPETACQGDRRVIVLRMGDELVGLLVERVDGIIGYHDEDVKSFSLLGSDKSLMFAGCLSRPGVPDTLLLDARHVLTSEELVAITHGHSRIYKAKALAEGAAKEESAARRTFITFRINGAYALPIGDVKEILGPPGALIKPPGLPAAAIGVLNLRGEMVLVADGRKIYGEPERAAASGEERVLVFQREGARFGVLVDCVEAIRTFSERDKVALPAALYRSDKAVERDIGEAVLFKDANGTETALVILSGESICRRLQGLRVA